MVLPFLFAVFVLVSIFQTMCCHEFDRGYVAVNLSPYVKPADEHGQYPALDSYSSENLRAMLKVISTKFSKVSQIDIGLFRDPESPEVFSTSVLGKIAEEAAQINRENNASVLEVIMGTRTRDQEPEKEVLAVLNLANNANLLNRGTVTKIMLTNYLYDANGTNATLNWIRLAKNESKSLGMDFKFGTMQHCDAFYRRGYVDHDTFFLRKKIIIETDFLYCYLKPDQMIDNFSGSKCFNRLLEDISQISRAVTDINPSIKLGGITQWLRVETSSRRNDKNLIEYWTEANKFASINKFPIILADAFDTPFRGLGPKNMEHGHTGWWKLAQANQINNVSAYVEKISSQQGKDESSKINIFSSVNFNNSMSNTTSCARLDMYPSILGFMLIFVSLST